MDENQYFKHCRIRNDKAKHQNRFVHHHYSYLYKAQGVIFHIFMFIFVLAYKRMRSKNFNRRLCGNIGYFNEWRIFIMISVGSTFCCPGSSFFFYYLFSDSVYVNDIVVEIFYWLMYLTKLMMIESLYKTLFVSFNVSISYSPQSLLTAFKTGQWLVQRSDKSIDSLNWLYK